MLRVFFLIFMILCNAVYADDIDVQTALQNVYVNCIDIENDLSEIKKLAGINTAVTAVGTGAGIGATAVGIAKSKVDEEMRYRLTKLREALAKANVQDVPKQDYAAFRASINVFDPQSVDLNTYQVDTDEEIRRLRDKSKRLGHWRTGLLGGAAATGVAGAIIANKTKTDEPLKEHVDRCVNSIDVLKKSVAIANLAGEDTFDAPQIIEACEQYKYVDLAKIDKKATGAQVSSVITATTGVTGTIISAIANSSSSQYI